MGSRNRRNPCKEATIRSTAMTNKSLSLDELVRKLMGDQHADVLRETLAWFVGRSNERWKKWPASDRRRPQRAKPRPHHAQERLPPSAPGRPGPARSRSPSAAAQRQLLSQLPGGTRGRARRRRWSRSCRRPTSTASGSARKVERLVTQLGLAGMSRSAVSRLCAGLDEQVRIFRERPLEGSYPYLWLDARVEKVREPGGVRSKALVVAPGRPRNGPPRDHRHRRR